MKFYTAARFVLHVFNDINMPAVDTAVGDGLEHFLMVNCIKRLFVVDEDEDKRFATLNAFFNECF